VEALTAALITELPMENGKRVIKPIAYGLVIFTTIGITIANALLSRVGLDHSYMYLFSVAFVLMLMLVGKRPVMVVLVLVGIVMINLPAHVLVDWHLDRDLLLGLLCAVFLVPVIYELLVG